MTNPFPDLRAVIARMREAADEWMGVSKLELRSNDLYSDYSEPEPLTTDQEENIVSISSSLVALMPGLRKITLGGLLETQVTWDLCGQLVGRYSNQLQSFHSSFTPAVPQDRVFAQLRDFAMRSFPLKCLENPLPRLDPEVIETLELSDFSANEMWSMFCAGPDDYAITFPRLTNLRLEYTLEMSTNPAQPLGERPWALQFTAAKRVSIKCHDEACPSLEYAVFPAQLESLDISKALGMLPSFAASRVQVSRDLALSMSYDPEEDNPSIEPANCILAASESCKVIRLEIDYLEEFPPEFITGAGPTHLQLLGKTCLDDMLEHIRRQRRLESLSVGCLSLYWDETDVSIPKCTEHEPVAPLDTQLRELTIQVDDARELFEPVLPVLKYLLLKIQTLRLFTTARIPKEPIKTFIDEYVQWYPHLADVKLMM
ncbi:hypothetical protein H4R19_002084 [Coemansia spiralis]|nr:hypothetical protein H4R19_002084 [Coemansia spiralis]